MPPLDKTLAAQWDTVSVSDDGKNKRVSCRHCSREMAHYTPHERQHLLKCAPYKQAVDSGLAEMIRPDSIRKPAAAPQDTLMAGLGAAPAHSASLLELRSPTMDRAKGHIYLQNIRFNAVIGQDAWSRVGKEQPVVVSVRLQRDVYDAGKTDNVQLTLNYSTVCKQILELAGQDSGFGSVEAFHTSAHERARLEWGWGARSIDLETRFPKAILQADTGLVTRSFSSMLRAGVETGKIEPKDFAMAIEGLKVACIIGVNAHERMTKQTVHVGLKYVRGTARSATPQRLAEVVSKVGSSDRAFYLALRVLS